MTNPELLSAHIPRKSGRGFQQTGRIQMRETELGKAFTLIESGPVILVTTHDGKKGNPATERCASLPSFASTAPGRQVTG